MKKILFKIICIYLKNIFSWFWILEINILNISFALNQKIPKTNLNKIE